MSNLPEQVVVKHLGWCTDLEMTILNSPRLLFPVLYNDVVLTQGLQRGLLCKMSIVGVQMTSASRGEGLMDTSNSLEMYQDTHYL